MIRDERFMVLFCFYFHHERRIRQGATGIHFPGTAVSRLLERDRRAQVLQLSDAPL